MNGQTEIIMPNASACQ